MNPDQQNQYDFIMSSQAPQKKPMLNLQNSSGPKRLLIIITFITFVLIVLIIGFNFLTSLGKANNDDLVLVEAHQTELLRVIDLGLKSANDPAFKNQLATLQATVKTDLNQTADLLKKRSVKVDKISLASQKNAEIDKELEAAKKNGKFDEAAIAAVQSTASKYYDSLKIASNDASGTVEPGILKTAIANIETILSN